MPSRSKICSEPRGIGLVAPAVGCAAALGLLLLTCCGPDAGSLDGGAARDAGRDAGARDGGTDAGNDAGQGHDGGSVEPTWLPLEGLPAGCELSMVADPEALVGPLRFEPCPDMAGCRQLVVDWTSQEDRIPTFLAYTGSHDGEHGYFVFGRGAEVGWYWSVIARDDGRILSVIRSPVPSSEGPFGCHLFNVAVSGAHAAITVATNSGESIGDSVIALLEWGDPASFRVLATLTPSELGPNNYVQQLAMGDDFVAGQVVPRNDIVRVGFDGSVRWVTGAEPGTPQLEAAGQDALFYTTLHPGTGLWTATASDAAGRMIWAPTDAEVGGIETDGEHLVWAQMSEMEQPYIYRRIELWTSPFTMSASTLTPRYVTDLNINFVATNLHYAWGHTAIASSTELMSVYSLASGRLGVVRPPTGTEFRDPFFIYLGPEELALAPHRLRAFPAESATLRIIRYDSLAPE